MTKEIVIILALLVGLVSGHNYCILPVIYKIAPYLKGAYFIFKINLWKK